MKKIIFIVFLFCTLVFMGSEPVYYSYLPVFMQREEMERAVKIESPRPIRNPGKIYIKDSYIYINEKYKGFHIINNQNPAIPLKSAFIHIDGCLDIAIKGDFIYVDNAVDLVVLNLNTLVSSSIVVGRVKNAFPEPSSPDGYWYNRQFDKFRPKNGIIVRWEKNQE